MSILTTPWPRAMRRVRGSKRGPSMGDGRSRVDRTRGASPALGRIWPFETVGVIGAGLSGALPRCGILQFPTDYSYRHRRSAPTATPPIAGRYSFLRPLHEGR